MPAVKTAHEWRTVADKIWTTLEETDRIVKENAKGFAELKESQKETDRIVKENARQIGKLGNRFGEMVESMVLPNLQAKFNEAGLLFTKVYRDLEIKDRANNIYAEVDAFLENGDSAVAVETKSKPDINDINNHIERMKKIRKYADLHGDKRKYLGAIAGMVFGSEEKNYALQKGFYVFEPSGETFDIIVPGSPQEW